MKVKIGDRDVQKARIGTFILIEIGEMRLFLTQKSKTSETADDLVAEVGIELSVQKSNLKNIQFMKNERKMRTRK